MNSATRSKQTAKHIIEVTDGINIIVALVLAVTPFVFGYDKGSRITTINVALGALIFLFAACRAFMAYDARSISLINIFLGLLTVVTPWTMHVSYIHSFLLTHLVCGSIVVCLSLIGLVVSHLNRPIGDHPW